MWPRFGIKIGNSTLCIASIKADAKVNVIANKQGDRVSQACLLWDGTSSEIECGLTAKQKMATRPKQAVAHAFQLLQPKEDLTAEQIATAVKNIPCEYVSDAHAFQLKCTQTSGDGDTDNEVTHQITPFEVHVQLLRAELELAHQYHTASEQKPIVVVSVPSYYPQAARILLANAAEEAGFHVAQIVSESTAAILGYKIGESDKESDATTETDISTTKYVLTIKSGGLFSHFALYSVHDGLYTQLDTFGPFPIGGKQFTEALVQFICDEFRRKYKLDPHESRRSLAKIRTAAANCKHILSTLPSTQVYIDSLMDGVDFNAQMSRARFESLIQPVINSFMQTLNECVEKALKQHTDVQKIDAIVLLGATMQIPKLQSVISARFPEAELHASMPADEIVSVGCALQAMYLADPHGQELVSTEECVFIEDDVTIWHADNESEKLKLFGKGAMLPSKVQVNVPLPENGNSAAKSFKVCVGEHIQDVQVSALTQNGTADKDDDDEEEEAAAAAAAAVGVTAKDKENATSSCCIEAEIEQKLEATDAANAIIILRAL